MGYDPEKHDKELGLALGVLTHSGGEIVKVKLSDRKIVKGPFLYGQVYPLALGKGVANHVALVGRVSGYLADGLGLDVLKSQEVGIHHDDGKVPFGHTWPTGVELGIWGREDLSAEEKKTLGYSAKLKESDPEADEEVAGWMRTAGLSEEVIEVALSEDFTRVILEPSLKAIKGIADMMCGQGVSTIDDRLNPMFQRMLLDNVGNLGDFDRLQQPIDLIRDNWNKFEVKEGAVLRMIPEHAAEAIDGIHGTAELIFDRLGTTDKKFIADNQLQDEEASAQVWEKIVRRTREADLAFQEIGGKGTHTAGFVKGVLQERKPEEVEKMLGGMGIPL